MGYVAVGEIKDEHASKKTRLKLACLAHAMNYNFTSFDKINEYKHLQSIAMKHIKELEDSSLKLKDISIDAMRKTINLADLEIKEIEENVAINTKRQDFLFKSLINDGYYDFKDRAFVVASTGRHLDFIKKNEEKKESWITDNRKLAELFVKDFKDKLPPDIPEKAFSFALLGDRESRFQKSDALVVTFNHVLEDTVKEALIKVTQAALARTTQDDYPENLRVDDDISKIHTLKYDDVKYIASCMQYLVETSGSSRSAGERTIEILRSADPSATLRDLDFQEQFPLMNIERYALFDNKLKGFIEDAFGGSIGRSKEGYRKAMEICMGHYAEEASKEFDMEKELARLDREMSGKHKDEGIDCEM